MSELQAELGEQRVKGQQGGTALDPSISLHRVSHFTKSSAAVM
jgi:hypothetical protein